MTLDVANRFEIKSRGVIKKGAYADVIVWDANSFKACSTYENPHLLSEGLYYAIINGEVSSFCDGKASVACGGRFLERS
jgi:N-acyl-D-amino-acid deacylase